MKYKTFRALVLSGVAVTGIAAVGGLYALASRPRPEPERTLPPPTPVAERPLELPRPQDSAATTASAATPGGLRPMDARILAEVEKPLASGKGKDAIPGQPWKVNLYQDPGQTKVNRLKIDLDRDEKWDEKWSREGGSWKRQVSSNDDDRYDREYLLANGAWSDPGAAAPRPAGTVAAAPNGALETSPSAGDGGSGSLRPLDTRILELARKPIAGNKIKDAFKTERWKVNVYQDAGHTKPNRLKVDYDRDEKWDEKWDFEGDEVKRHVAPNDDEVYSKEYRLRGGAWVEKPVS